MRHTFAIAVLSGGLLALAAEPAGATSAAAASRASAPILMAPAAAGYEYLSPEPGSKRNSRWNNVVLRPGGPLSPGRPDARALSVTGSTSGRHDGRFEVSDDGRTLVFTPARPFDPGETVRVRLAAGLRSNALAPLAALDYSFRVATTDPKLEALRDSLTAGERLTGEVPRHDSQPAKARGFRADGVAANVCTPLPADYPFVSVITRRNPGGDAVFLSPFFGTSPVGRLLILDTAGQPLFYRRVPRQAFDFKRQPDGRLTYFSGDAFWVLDSTYALVDSFRTGNGYSTDVHDLQLLPNGHALMMSYDSQPVRLDSIVPGGDPDGRATGLIVQELDAARNVVFQWRSWDHYQITDAESCLIDLHSASVDYVHGNAVTLAPDGNLLISARSMNEITKISRTTGQILWRLGRNAKNNQFSFPNDPRGWAGQHDIRILPNRHITLFDNGNCQSTPPYSRALEYELDEGRRIAWLVWEFRNAPDSYGPFMGNVQRRADGRTTVGWGGTPTDPKFTDLNADGSEGLEFGFSFSTMWSYRSFRFPWHSSILALGPDTVDFGRVSVGQRATRSIDIRNRSSQPLRITCVQAASPAYEVVSPIPFTIAPGGHWSIAVRVHGNGAGDDRSTLYVRSTDDTSLVAESVSLRTLMTATLPSARPPAAVVLGLALLALALVALRRRRGATLVAWLLLPLAAAAPSTARALDDPAYEYVSPDPGSERVSRWNNVVIRAGGSLARVPWNGAQVSVSGSASGPHEGRLERSDDDRTLVFEPARPFDPGETVRVRLAAGLPDRDGRPLPALDFAFHIGLADPRLQPVDLVRRLTDGAPGVDRLPSRPPGKDGMRSRANVCTPMPTDYPLIFLTARHEPGPEPVFVSPFAPGQRAGRLLILDTFGQPLFFRRLPLAAFDFTRQSNGRLTYFSNDRFFALDSSYAVVDTFRAGNGYTTDLHELQLLANGHALLMSYDPQPVPMDEVVPGGRNDATVIGLIVQELDQAKHVVFQWRSWDHFQITDADTCLVSLRDSVVDYAHGNAIALDRDGNLLISSRSMNEITKISRTTGAILWRLGRNAKRNQFKFPNDPRGFAGQHDVRRLPSGRITLFDNGNCLGTTPYSRTVEYELDEGRRIAWRVWEFRNAPDAYAPFMGSVQRRTNGHTAIGWGGATSDPKFTDVTPDGAVDLEIGFGFAAMWTYRAFRFPWTNSVFAVTPDTLDFGSVALGGTAARTFEVRNRSSAPLTITCIQPSSAAYTVTTPVPFTVPAGATKSVALAVSGSGAGDDVSTLYVRTANDTSLVAQAIGLRTHVVASLPSARPNAILLLGLGLLASALLTLRRRRGGGERG